MMMMTMITTTSSKLFGHLKVFTTAAARKFETSISNEITKVCMASYSSFGEKTVHTNRW